MELAGWVGLTSSILLAASLSTILSLRDLYPSWIWVRNEQDKARDTPVFPCTPLTWPFLDLGNEDLGVGLPGWQTISFLNLLYVEDRYDQVTQYCDVYPGVGFAQRNDLLAATDPSGILIFVLLG